MKRDGAASLAMRKNNKNRKSKGPAVDDYYLTMFSMASFSS
jgi:hypothetical protein